MTEPAHFPPIPLAVALPVAIGRVLVIAASLAVWFWTQRLLARRNTPAGGADASEGSGGFDKTTSGSLSAGASDGLGVTPFPGDGALLPLPVLRERVGVRVSFPYLRHDPHPRPLPEYREREWGFRQNGGAIPHSLAVGGADVLSGGGSSTLTAVEPTAVAAPPAGAICDRLHLRTTRINQRLNADPRLSRMLLISSSLVIDLLGLYMLGSAIFGRTFEPFLGLFMVFALRQIIQAFCPLPPPDGMIWRDTGFPTLLVTYGTSNDLFFSGHTAIAVYGAATLASAWGPPGIAVGLAIVFFEIAAVLLLRAHYTMDVFAGAVAALYIHRLAIDFAPTVDRWIGYSGKLGHF